MDCWKILGVEPFSDKKTIKVAYAKQLKLNRPDDDPEGFKSLHRAYQSALNWTPEAAVTYSGSLDLSPQLVLVPSEEALDSALTEEVIEALLNNSVEPSKKIYNAADQQLLDEIREQENLIGEDWQSLYINVGQIIKSNTDCNDLDEWRFLESLSSMNDLEFRKAASDQVFEIIAEVNAVSLENNHLHIKRPVINYLNTLFSWDVKWQEYQLIHSKRLLNSVYPYLEEADKPEKGINKKRELYYYRRGAAFAIDLAIFVAPVLVYAMFESLFVSLDLIDDRLPNTFSGELLIGIWGLIYFLLVIPLQETSKYQATIGKYFLGLQVINSQGDRIGLFRSFWRGLLTFGCCIGFKVVIFINIVLSYWRSEILQDTLSRSYVIMRPGYR